MTVQKLVDSTDWEVIAGNTDREITSAYICDLLSCVMAKGQEGTAWVTVQTHLNVLAVASLHDFSCVIIPEKIEVSKNTLDTANEKNVCILRAACSSYGVAMCLGHLGIGEV